MKSFQINVYPSRKGIAMAYLVTPDHKRTKPIPIRGFVDLRSLVECLGGLAAAEAIFSGADPEPEE